MDKRIETKIKLSLGNEFYSRICEETFGNRKLQSTSVAEDENGDKFDNFLKEMDKLKDSKEIKFLVGNWKNACIGDIYLKETGFFKKRVAAITEHGAVFASSKKAFKKLCNLSKEEYKKALEG